MAKHPSLAPGRFVAELRREPNELKKKLLLVGYLTERLSKAGETVFLVGGQAVETYTGGVFTTGDIDITTTDRKAAESLLAKMGFSKEGMIWVNARLGIAVHIVGSYPTRSEKSRTIEVGRYSVRIVGVEDLIVDRLAAAKFWHSQRDGEQARALLDTFKNGIDHRYLETRAKEEKVEDVLAEVRDRRVRASRPG